MNSYKTNFEAGRAWETLQCYMHKAKALYPHALSASKLVLLNIQRHIDSDVCCFVFCFFFQPKNTDIFLISIVVVFISRGTSNEYPRAPVA